MPYSPPLGWSVVFDLVEDYSPPSGWQVVFDLSDRSISVVAEATGAGRYAASGSAYVAAGVTVQGEASFFESREAQFASEQRGFGKGVCTYSGRAYLAHLGVYLGPRAKITLIGRGRYSIHQLAANIIASASMVGLGRYGWHGSGRINVSKSSPVAPTITSTGHGVVGYEGAAMVAVGASFDGRGVYALRGEGGVKKAVALSGYGSVLVLGGAAIKVRTPITINARGEYSARGDAVLYAPYDEAVGSVFVKTRSQVKPVSTRAIRVEARS